MVPLLSPSAAVLARRFVAPLVARARRAISFGVGLLGCSPLYPFLNTSTQQQQQPSLPCV
jgi:hypothetical protein